MKTDLIKKAVGFAISLTMTVSYAVPFAFAEETALEPDEVLLGETVDLEEYTNEEDTFVYDEDTYVELDAVSGSKTWTFDTYADTSEYNSETDLDGLTVYASEDAKVALDANKKTFEGVEYTHRLKLSGSGSFDGNVPAARVVGFVPETSGTVKVHFAHASSSGDPRTLVIKQGDNETTQEVKPNEQGTVTCNVEAKQPVYIYSQKSGLNMYAIIYKAEGSGDTQETTEPEQTAEPVETTEPEQTAEPVETTEPEQTAEPAETTEPEQTAEPVVTENPSADVINQSKTWTFDTYGDTAEYSSETDLDGLTLYANADAKVNLDKSNKSFDGVKYTHRLKLGGSGSFDGDVPAARVLGFIPGMPGTVTVHFAHASSSGDSRTLAIKQGDQEASQAVEPNGLATATCSVEANKPVYIYSQSSGLNIYAIIYTVSGGSQATTEPSTSAPSTSAPSDSTAAPATPTPDANTVKAEADAKALTLKSISDYAVYIDLDLAKKGDNGSTITWESSNEDYISIQEISASGANYTGVVTRPTTDEECVDGGVPVTLTATVKNGNAVVIREFNVSVRKFEPLYYNDFQQDVGKSAEGDYKAIEDNVESVTGETFRGIRVGALKQSRALKDYGFDNNDKDTESYFDKRIMSTDEKYGKPVVSNQDEENFAFYYSEYNAYGGSSTIPLWIKFEDAPGVEEAPEGIVVMSMDLYIVSRDKQKFNIGIANSKPSQMCRFLLNSDGALRYFSNETTINYMGGKDGYVIPEKKWITATIVANSTTHKWDFYFDGMRIATGLDFRNAEDAIPAIEFTTDRNTSGGKYLIDNIRVENITDDFNTTYWDTLTLDNLEYDAETDTYIADKDFLLMYTGTGALTGNVYSWKSSNPDVLSVGVKSIPVEDLLKYGYTQEQIDKYKEQGKNTVAVTLAELDNDNIPEEGVKVTLTGSMIVDDETYKKEFTVLVKKSNSSEGDLTDKEKAEADIANAIANIKGKTYYSNTMLDFTKTGKLYGSEIEWSSSNTDVITDFGDVIRPSTTTTTTVKITVTAKYGEEVVEESFNVYVRGSKTTSSSGGGGGGGGGASSGSGGIRVSGAVTGPSTSFGTEALTPEEAAGLIFNDIGSVDWAKEAIEALYEKNIISGYGNGLFNPNGAVTREQFVKMVVLALGLSSDSSEGMPFTDVDSQEWYAPYISTAYDLGIVTGKDDGSFGIGESITRQDMAVMCMRALNAAGIELTQDASLNDMDTISDYAKDAVSKMAGAGYITGDENAYFNPMDTATRAQTAVVLYRVITK